MNLIIYYILNASINSNVKIFIKFKSFFSNEVMLNLIKLKLFIFKVFNFYDYLFI